MTPTQKLADLKRRVDEAVDEGALPLAGSYGHDLTSRREMLKCRADLLCLEEAARILSRLIEKMPKEQITKVDCDYVYGKNALRQAVIDIILEDK
jgi:hypothetical protein